MVLMLEEVEESFHGRAGQTGLILILFTIGLILVNIAKFSPFVLQIADMDAWWPKDCSLPLTLSLLFHCALGLFGEAVLRGRSVTFTGIILPEKTVIQMGPSRQRTPWPRTVGRDDGDESFSVDIPKRPGDLRLENLQILSIQDIQREEAETEDEQLPVRRGLGRERFQRRKTLERLGVSPQDAHQLSYTDLDIQFIPPVGVSEDELNSVEKKFYSFQRRTFLAYVSSFVRTHRRLSRERPLLTDTLEGGQYSLTGRVLYNSEGDTLSLHITRTTPEGDVHDLFEQTLEDMGRLPNPPIELVGPDQTFTLYYKLDINL